jgi:sugar phosphate isomerase/epimerase
VSDHVMICAKQANFDACVALARQHGLGIEVQTFAYPDALDGDWLALIHHYRAALEDVPGPVALHGPFMDMASGSVDPVINRVVRERALHALHIAAELGARTIVFHANFIATMRNPDYRTGWTQRQIEFWEPLAEQVYRQGQVIALENMWEYEPDIIGAVVRELDHPGLRVCLDVGHAHLFSDIPLDVWIDRLHALIAHIHINNNDGLIDEHHALDDGVLDYQALLPKLCGLPNRPPLALEIEDTGDLARSLAYLRRFRACG